MQICVYLARDGWISRGNRRLGFRLPRTTEMAKSLKAFQLEGNILII